MTLINLKKNIQKQRTEIMDEITELKKQIQELKDFKKILEKFREKERSLEDEKDELITAGSNKFFDGDFYTFNLLEDKIPYKINELRTKICELNGW